MKKITSAQFISLLILSRLFVTMTYTPTGNENPLITIVGGLLSALIQLVLIVPPLILARRFQDKNILTVGYCVSRPVGILLTVVYGLFFSLSAVKVLCDFSHFVSFAFPVFSFNTAVILSMAVVCSYIASLGLKPLTRTSVITLFLFVMMLFIVVLGSHGDMDSTNLTLYSDNTLSRITRSAFQSLGRGSSLVLACFLLPNLKGRRAAPLISFVWLKYAVVALIVYLYTSILGSYATTAQLPFFHLSSYSDTAIIARFDPIFLIVWTMTGICHLSALIWALSVCVQYALPKCDRRRLCYILSLSIFTVSALLLWHDLWNFVKRFFVAGTAVILLTGIIPLVLLLHRKERAK